MGGLKRSALIHSDCAPFSATERFLFRQPVVVVLLCFSAAASECQDADDAEADTPS